MAKKKPLYIYTTVLLVPIIFNFYEGVHMQKKAIVMVLSLITLVLAACNNEDKIQSEETVTPDVENSNK